MSDPLRLGVIGASPGRGWASRAHLPPNIQESAFELLVAPARHEDEPRPTLQAHGNYIFGVFLVAVDVPAEDRLFYQEVDAVVMRDVFITVSKTPVGEHPYDPRPAREGCRPDDSGGMMLYRLVDLPRVERRIGSATYP